MMNRLYKLEELVGRLKETSSSTEKKQILRAFPECRTLLADVYDPYKKFFVTSSQLKKLYHLNQKIIDTPDIFSLISALSSRLITGHEAISQCNWFIGQNTEYRDLIYNIIDRDLKCRIAAKTLNSVWKGTIKEFSVALAQKFEDYQHRVDFDNDEWLASRKFDGIRIIALVDNNDVIFKSRRGHENETLNNLKPLILDRFNSGTVLDGEICIIDAEGNENFTQALSMVLRKDFTIERPIFKIFDVLDLEEFKDKRSNRRLSLRIRDGIEAGIPFESESTHHDLLQIVNQQTVVDEKYLKFLQMSAASKNWEGLILRKNSGYQGKRSPDMLKLKQFKEAEYTVENLTYDNLRFVENGKEVTRMMLSSVDIVHKGELVSVGSGFSKDERLKYYKDPDSLVGKKITVKYFEESVDKDGKLSLRFPVVKAIHSTKRKM